MISLNQQFFFGKNSEVKGIIERNKFSVLLASAVVLTIFLSNSTKSCIITNKLEQDLIQNSVTA